MKSLKTIQTLAKVGKILSLIAFILCIVCAVFCAIGVAVLPAMKDKVIQDGKTLEQLLIENKTNFITAITVCVIALISTLAGVFTSFLTLRFFKRELEVGTPFRFEIANKMKKLGLIHVIVSLALLVTIAIIVASVKSGHKELQDIKGTETGGTLWFGIALLILSVFCRYGAEKEDAIEAKAE